MQETFEQWYENIIKRPEYRHLRIEPKVEELIRAAWNRGAFQAATSPPFLAPGEIMAQREGFRTIQGTTVDGVFIPAVED